MHGEIVQPEVPELFANLALGGIAMLVQGFQVAEDAGKLLARNAEFLGVYGVAFVKRRLPMAGDGWRGIQNNSFGGVFSIAEIRRCGGTYHGKSPRMELD